MTLIAPNLTGFSWKDVRAALADCIRLADPLATVHREWKLEFDPPSGLGRATALMNGVGDHATFAHCWMIGLASQRENTNEAGVPNTVGGATADYNLTFATWGFFDYGSWRTRAFSQVAIADDSAELNVTDFAEAATRAITAVLRVNPQLGLNSGRVRYAYPPELENADSHAFAGGKNLIVIQNSITVRVRESFA